MNCFSFAQSYQNVASSLAAEQGCSDVDRMRSELDQLCRTVLAHDPKSGTPLAVPRLRVRLNRSPTTPTPLLFEPMLYVVLQGTKRLTVGHRAIEYAAGSLVIMTLDLPATGEVIRASVGEPYLALELLLDRSVVAALLLDLPNRAEVDVEGFSIDALPPQLLDPLIRLVGLLDAPGDIAILAPMIEREILYKVLRSARGGMLRQFAMPESRLSQIGKAVDHMRAHPDEPLRIGELAGLAGMSVTSFHRHFKAVTAMSPHVYGKQIKLQEARRRLLAEPGQVAQVANSIGYESPSQFSREYKRLFGWSPARDAVRLRQEMTQDRDRMAPRPVPISTTVPGQERTAA